MTKPDDGYMPPDPVGKFVRKAMRIGRTPREVLDAYKKILADYELDGDTLDQVKWEPVEYLWHPYLPIGKMTLLTGSGGVGKSLVHTDWLARVTSGDPWPTSAWEPAGTGQQRKGRFAVLLSAEDGLRDTIKPRFLAAGGDPSRLWVPGDLRNPGDNDRQIFVLNQHFEMLKRKLDFYRPALVIVDPIDAYLGDLDTRSTTGIRNALRPLTDLAEEYRFALVVVHHLNKGSASGRSVQNRVSGSHAYLDASRLAYMVLSDDEAEPDRRYFVCIKTNLGRRPLGLTFKIDTRRLEEGDRAADIGILAWDGRVDESAEALSQRLANPVDDSDTALGRAKLFLTEILADGPMFVADIEKEAKEAGIAWASVQRARDRLGLKHRKLSKLEDERTRFQWELPEGMVPPVRHHHPEGAADAVIDLSPDRCVVCDAPFWRVTLLGRPVCAAHAPSDDQLLPADLDPTKPPKGNPYS